MAASDKQDADGLPLGLSQKQTAAVPVRERRRPEEDGDLQGRVEMRQDEEGSRRVRFGLCHISGERQIRRKSDIRRTNDERVSGGQMGLRPRIPRQRSRMQ